MSLLFVWVFSEEGIHDNDEVMIRTRMDFFCVVLICLTLSCYSLCRC